MLQDAYDKWTWERAVAIISALALVGGPPLTAPLKLALQHLRASGEHLAQDALRSVFTGTMRTQNRSRLSVSHWTEAFSSVKDLWARLGTYVTRARRHDFALADEQAKKDSAQLPCVAQVEHFYRARVSFL